MKNIDIIRLYRCMLDHDGEIIDVDKRSHGRYLIRAKVTKYASHTGKGKTESLFWFTLVPRK